MRTVYDEKGESFTVDSVDAREYLATGRFFSEPPQPEKPKPASKPAPKPKTTKKVKDDNINTSISGS